MTITTTKETWNPTESEILTVKLTDIDFDTDGDDELNEELKEEYIGKTYSCDTGDDIFDEFCNVNPDEFCSVEEYLEWRFGDGELTDMVSDESGWCIFGLNYTLVG